VTVKDNVAPVALAKNITVQLNASGTVSITANDINNGSNDNCGINSMSVSPNSFTCANVGANTVTLTVTDNNSNVSTADATVTVEDNVAPVALIKNITVQLNAFGTVSIAATDINNGSNDNCGIQSMSASPNSFNCTNVGANTVTLTVTDNNGNESTADATVTVGDNVAPVAIAQDVMVQLDATGNGSTTAAAVDNGSNDACGIASLTLSKTDFDCSEVGANTVTLTVTDNNGKVSSANATVTVEDNVAPVVIAQDVTVQLDATGNGSTTAAAMNNGSNDACGIASLTLSKTDFDCSEVGSNAVTLTVTDINGNVSTENATVTVEDNVDAVALAKDITVQLDASGNVSITAADVDNGSNDACGIASMSVSPNSFTCAEVGDNTVTLTVTDINGNVSTENATVTVEDNVDAVALAKDITVQLDASGNVSITAADVDNGSNDACGIKSITVSPSSFTCNDIGPNMATLTVRDSNDNVSTNTATVTVEDVTPPNIPVLENITWGCEYTVTPPTTTDTCDTNVTVTASRSTTFTTTGTIIWTFTDDSNNSSQSIEQTITINPISVSINKVDIICYGFATGEAEAIVTGGVGPFTYDWGSLGTGPSKDGLNPGSYSVTIKDKNGCSATKPFTITQPPILNATLTTTNVTCNGANDGTISVTNPQGGHGTFEYSIGGIDWQATGSFLNLPNDTYSVQIRDEAHTECVIILDPILEITQPEILTSFLDSQDDVKCKGFTTGAATINASGGTAPYTFSWGSFGTGATKTDLSAGTYSIIVTDNNGCTTLPLEVVITEPDNFIEIVNIVTFSGCSTTFDKTATTEVQGGTGIYTYLWSDGQTSQTATGLAPGNYSVTIKDGNLCETQKSVTITAPSQLVIEDISTTETTSFGSATGTATVNVNGGTPNYEFLWSDSEAQKTQTAINLSAGTYEVVVTDSNGCKVEKKLIKIYDQLYSEIEASATCAAKKDAIRTSFFSSINTKGGSGSYTYSWEFGDNFSASGIGTHTVKYQTSGQKNIILTVTDNDPDRSEFTFTSSIIIYAGECFGKCGSNDLRTEEIYLGNSAGVPYNLAEKCENVSNEALWIQINEPGNSKRYNLYMEYVVLIYHPDGTVTEVSSIEQCVPGLIDQDKPSKIIDIDYNCGDRISVEKFFLSVTSKKNGGCNAYTDGPKCTATEEPVEVESPLSANATGSELLCNGASNGKVTVIASGGSRNYQFSINTTPVKTSADQKGKQYIFENLNAGTYTVTVKDDGGRSIKLSEILVIQPTNPLTLVLKTSKGLICNGGNDAEVTAKASGGTAPYTYVWDNGQSTITATGLSAGSHKVTVTDKNGCQVSETIDVIEPPILIANAGSDQILNCGVTQVKLSAVFNPYTNPVTGVEEFGAWTVVNGPVGSNFIPANDPESLFTIQTPGTYTLRWTVPCGATDDVKITISNCRTIDFDGIDDQIDFGDNFNPSGDFTFEAWIKQNTNATAGTKTVFAKRDLSNLGTGFDLIIENGIPKFRWNNSEIIASNAIGKDRWYHLAVISNGSGTKLYVDGINVGNEATASPVDNNFKFLIGAMYDSGTTLKANNYFHGWIEEVRIWKTALTEEQLRFMMNQRIKVKGSNVSGVEIPMDVPGNLAWNNLDGYYRMEKVSNGFTIGETASGIKGKLINIITTQERTAPLPYISAKAGLWFDDTTWLHPQVWDAPNSKGINSDTINWNIARISHNINSGARDITLLGLLSESGKLKMDGATNISTGTGSGQGLWITHYLKLNGVIDLEGESQLLQKRHGIYDVDQVFITTQFSESILEPTSSGYIERDQQGTASSFNYNYWSSPVVPQGNANDSTYTVASVMMDGSTGTNYGNPLSFDDWYEYADYTYGNDAPRRISNYWIYKFRGDSNVYSEWERVGSTDTLLAGEGYTMKGTSGSAEISDRQNYVFKGKPNNRTINLDIGLDQNYLLGNPYPSAISIKDFILDNLNKDIVTGATNTKNIFNGAVYFWDHFSGKTHILAEYIGGYATANILGATPAVATDERINATGGFGKTPGYYIPVAQGFFINTLLDPESSDITEVDWGEVIFKNSQRAFVKETNPDNSQFLRPETNSKKDKQEDTRARIRLDYRSPMGYNRQILVGADPNTTNEFDLGYDAPLNDNNLEDMFWLINGNKFVIQGVPNFEIDQVLPLGIKLEEEGDFSIKINKLENIAEDVNIYLKNLEDSTYVDLRKGDFTMKLEPGNYNERFQIVFQKEKIPTEEPDPDEETEEEEQEQGSDEGSGEDEFADGNIEVFYMGNHRELAILNPEKFKIQRVVIYDMLGQIIQEYENISNEKEVWLPVRVFPAAVYAIKLFSGNKEISKSIILIR
jgi:hypothetical protein